MNMSVNDWCLLFYLLFVAVDHMLSECLPKNTPWTNVCKARCEHDNSNEVQLSACNVTTLHAASNTYIDYDVKVAFRNSRITNVSKNAFNSFIAEELVLQHSFVNFEDAAFSGLWVDTLSITDNPGLITLPVRAFLYLGSVLHLNLSNNNLHHLPAYVFRQFEVSLTSLDISGNSISCFEPKLFMHEASELDTLYITQKVEVRGLCPRSLKGIRKIYYNATIDQCVLRCTEPGCDCDSYEGCLNCTGDGLTANKQPAPTTGGAMKASATGEIWLLFSQVMMLMCAFY